MAKERNGRHLTPNPRARSERRVDQATSHGAAPRVPRGHPRRRLLRRGFRPAQPDRTGGELGHPGFRWRAGGACGRGGQQHLRVRLGPGGRCGGHPLHVLHGRDRPYIGHLFHARRLDEVHRATPYATYYNPDLYNTYIKETTERSYAGIGVVFADYNGAPT